ncbi:MAG TPA: dTDP-glucose 4,6-dehydratase [Anaerolineaceae bacterium]
MAKHLLVTGGAGFIGANFIHHLLSMDAEVRVTNLDALTYAGSLENLRYLPDPDRHEFVHGSITDRDLVTRLLRERDITHIVHFAAESHVDRSILGPAVFIETNINGTFTLLDAAREVWFKEKKLSADQVRFHHVSTDEVFGSLGPNDPPFEETTPYSPRSPYSASKASSDHLVRAYGHTYGLPATISNCTNNYGPYQFPEKLIPLMILNALNGLPLPVYGDGKQIRDWLYVGDHCEAIWEIVQRGTPGETYCIGGNNQPTNIEIVTTICGLLDELLPPGSPTIPHSQYIRYVTDRPGHDRRYAMNISKIQRELGWQPRYDVHSGLRQTVQWYLDNTEWVKAIREQQNYQQWLQSNYSSREGVK